MRWMLVVLVVSGMLPVAAAAMPPTLTVPVEIVAEATGPSGAIVHFAGVLAVDAGGNPAAVSCTPASGGLFPIGSTTVSCTATDDAGTTSAADTFTVRVVDSTAPTLYVPSSFTIFSTTPTSAILQYQVGAVDAVDPRPTVACSHPNGAVLPAGSTTISCAARDATGNTASAAFTVIVCDLVCQFDALRAGTAAVDTKSLLHKVDMARADYDDGNIRGACTHLGSYAQGVSSKGGRQIPQPTADGLLTYATSIQRVLACK